MFSQPACAHSAICGASDSGVSGKPVSAAADRAARRSDKPKRAPARCAPVPRRSGRISLGPSAQFMPTLSGSACETEFQNASTVCPVSVRPLRSVIVPEIMIGRSRPEFGEHIFGGKDRRLRVERVKDRLDEQHVHAALDERAHLLGVSLPKLIEIHRAESSGRSHRAKSMPSPTSARSRRPRIAARPSSPRHHPPPSAPAAPP